ncbi:MAG: aspartate-semialdehyde dehydrogenase, partial [Clostridia bacterium]|nr:aspartate-semialdehyde dehydrogenase [Clostridia bacterium]
MNKLKAGVIGATGMVGQRFITLLLDHPYFELTALYASARSAGRSYGEAVDGRWKMTVPLPEKVAAMPVYDAADTEGIRSRVDFVFCAVNMDKEETRAFEEALAKAEIPVVSNNSAHRGTPDVPMIMPEINPDHTAVIAQQKKRLGTKRGFIAVKPNCSIQSYVPLLHPLMKFEPTA